MHISASWPRLGGLALLALLGCSNAGEDFGFNPSGSGTVLGFVYLDRDGTLDITQGDTVFAGVRVGLVVSGTTDTVKTALVDATGNVRFTGVPFGNYQFVVDSTTVGDSLEIQAIDTAAVHLRANGASQTVVSRLGFPLTTIAAARGLPIGSRIFVVGTALAPLDVFGDTTAHIQGGGVAIRLANARDGGFPSSAGDSVRVLGTVTLRAGQPVLDTAIVYAFNNGPAAVPVALTTLQANTADGGAQDAALVQITNANIDSTSVAVPGQDFHAFVSDGTGTLEIVLDGDLTLPVGQFQVGKKVTGRGLLVPTGTGTWVFKPRLASDVTVS
ncbi:MAG: hypothetical protein ABI679_09495 [Gemmatimonadota bacterium]